MVEGGITVLAKHETTFTIHFVALDPKIEFFKYK